MPYIKPEQRIELDGHYRGPSNAGELNYCVTKLIRDYWYARRNYQAIAEITGVLIDAKDEFKRRIVVPYEQKKIQENGDVYPVETK